MSYRKGLHDLGTGCFAWLQPDGSWGWSNAGLVVDGEATLLVDTLFDLRLTAEMLAAMRAAVPSAARIDVLVNTHANGDHCYGNELVRGAAIVASEACAKEFGEVPPEVLAQLVANSDALGPVAGEFVRRAFGPFEFAGITLTPPTETFSGESLRQVGAKDVHLLEVGPAHTRGDVLVHVPADRTVFTGDIVFANAHPIIWAGPIGNWVRACDAILGMEVDTVVPGHGPLCGPETVSELRGYLTHIEAETRRCYEAGLDREEAARAIALDDYAAWGDAERIAVNVAALYREFGDDAGPPNPLELFTLMAQLARDRR
jgi:glyoxylase-like metal-dependent hydrolase (beta-lactamase superfamily II)